MVASPTGAQPTSPRLAAEYADRKNDEEDEHVADSLLYDRNHLPRTAPAPECVQRALQQQRQEGQQQGRPVPAQVP